MIINNKEKKEILKCDAKLASDNVSKCAAFVFSLGTNNKTLYEYKELLDEYIKLNKLRTYLDYCMYFDDDMLISDVQYLLIRKWAFLNLKTYIDISSEL